MNAAVRTATVLLRQAGAEVFGVSHGFRGLLRDELEPLELSTVANILREGGTILGSARAPEFSQPAARALARKHLAARGIEGCVVIGGNGSLAGARALSDPEELGPQRLLVVGVPASIDNDIGLTGLAIGVDTAMNTIVEACDKIADTASAFDRTFIIEVMGRDSGYLAMTSAIAAGADAVLFPENQPTPEAMVDAVLRTAARVGQRSGRARKALIIKSEGTPLSSEELKRAVDAAVAERGASFPSIETRVTVLGHVVRGGRPSAFDRLLASRLARVATQALIDGQTRKMAAWMLPVELPAAIAQRSAADPYCMLVDIDAVLAETDRLRLGTSPLVQWRRRVFEELESVLPVG
jgi:6-phosphofructokinase 1